MVYRCPKCDELVTLDPHPVALCPECGTPLGVTPPAVVVSSSPIALTLEDPGPKLDRIVGTLRQIITAAPRFFHKLESSERARAAETFAYVVATLGFAGYFGNEWWLIGDDAVAIAGAMANVTGLPAADPERIVAVFRTGTLLSPLLGLLPVHLCAGLYHIGLWFTGAEHRGFTVTFKVAAYGLAPMALCVIPGIGWMLAPGGCLALHWVGLAAAHRLSLFQAAATVLLTWAGFTLFAGGIIGKALLFWLYPGDLPAVGM